MKAPWARQVGWLLCKDRKKETRNTCDRDKKGSRKMISREHQPQIYVRDRCSGTICFS